MANDFSFEDDAPRERRIVNRQDGNFRTGFGCAFGGALGIAAAVVVVLVLIFGSCAGIAMIGHSNSSQPATKFPR